MKYYLIILAMALSAVSTPSFAASASDAVRQCVSVAQSISLNNPADPATAVVGDVIPVAWTVTSNNAFRYVFSGKSKDDNGNDLAFPQFIKQDVDASGNPVANKYDTLDTTYGVQLSDYESVQKGDRWGNGEAAAGAASILVGSAETSPYGQMGRIMTGDETSKATITLFSKGIADTTDQSGIYTSEVMLTVTAEEQLDSATCAFDTASTLDTASTTNSSDENDKSNNGNGFGINTDLGFGNNDDKHNNGNG